MKYLSKVYWIVSNQFGLNPIAFINSFLRAPKFIRDYIYFKKSYDGKIEIMPCLHDRHEEGGGTKTEYFWQDIYVAQKINARNPKKHVDIGSRVDGFVAHVASFRQIEVFDIRDITSKIPNIIFKQADLMNPLTNLYGYCDSLSCLHALEHFGLGRYGDKIDINGYKLGLINMGNILKEGGVFYLSVPIGIPKVFFNAHRIFDPEELVLFLNKIGFKLQEFSWFNEHKVIISSTDITNDISTIKKMTYVLGIFTFIKQ